MADEELSTYLVPWLTSRLYSVRTIVPGKLDALEAGIREQSADFEPGIADLVAGEPDPQSITPGAPVMNIAGGGYYFLLPTSQGDEVLGLVSDRPTGLWRQNRETGDASKINGQGAHDMSDVMLTPFAITAPPGAPDTWDHPIIGGPQGPAFEVESDGKVTLTKGGTPVATITMDSAGTITIEVEAGQTVKLGGASATLGVARQTDTTGADTAMTAWIASVQAITAALAPSVALPPPVPPTDFGVITSASTKVLSE